MNNHHLQHERQMSHNALQAAIKGQTAAIQATTAQIRMGTLNAQILAAAQAKASALQKELDAKNALIKTLGAQATATQKELVICREALTAYAKEQGAWADIINNAVAEQRFLTVEEAAELARQAIEKFKIEGGSPVNSRLLSLAHGV